VAESTVWPSRGRGDEGVERPALALPRGEAAIEQGDAIVPQPAQHPPQAHGEAAAAVVVHDDLAAGRDAAPVHARGEIGEGRQGVAAVLPRLRAREILVQVHEEGAGDVARLPELAALVGVREVVARVEDDPVGISQARGERFGRDEHFLSFQIRPPPLCPSFPREWR
jgi:hypothetical protein